MSAKPPYGDCVDIDEETNKMLNYYAYWFSYSTYLCVQTISQVLIMKWNGDCTTLVVPCNPLNITKLYEKNISDIPMIPFQAFQSWFLRCPRKCTEQFFDVKHAVSEIPPGEYVACIYLYYYQ